MNHLSHAPGPWRVSFERNRVYIKSDMPDPRSDQESLVVCQVPIRTKGCNNLNILLHAPELVAALERVALEAAAARNILMNHADLVELDKAINDSIDVLCKAKGV
jgi:hypothetical protein